MISTEDLQFFMAIAKASSLASAARSLDVTPSAVTLRLQGLERKLGIRLVDRSGRRIVLTDEGELVASRGKTVLDDIASLAEDLATRHNKVSGHLRIAAPLGFGRKYIAPLAGTFRTQFPAISIELKLSLHPDRVPLSAWDVMIDMGRMRHLTLIMHRLAPNDRMLCAAPAYLLRRGRPSHPSDLRRHECIALRTRNEEDATMWRFRSRYKSGEVVSVRVAPVLMSNDVDIVRFWLLQGHGIAMRSEWHVAEDIRAGRLVRILDEYVIEPKDVIALLHSDQRSQAFRTKTFIKYLRRAFTPPPWRIGSDQEIA